ncbi:MAG: hypothetical protein ACK4F5_01785 [Aliihoeflea sp.]
MSHKSFVELINLLVERTNKNRQNWEEGPRQGSFYTQIGSNSVSIKAVADDYIITLYNQDGDQVDEISDPTLKQGGFEEAYGVMGELFDMARRNALGADKVLNDILNELKRI